MILFQTRRRCKLGDGNLRSKLSLTVLCSFNNMLISSVTRTKHIFFSAFYLRANNRPAVSESSEISTCRREEKVKRDLSTYISYASVSQCLISQSKPVSLSELPQIQPELDQLTQISDYNSEFSL